jgi:hypothetical protein
MTKLTLFWVDHTHSTPIVLMNCDLKALSWVELTVNRTIKQVLPTPEFPIVRTFSIVELSYPYKGFGA